MSIVSSVYELDGPVQSDGRRFVIERHTGSDGVIYSVTYLAAIGADYAAIMAARVASLVDQLGQDEFERVLAT